MMTIDDLQCNMAAEQWTGESIPVAWYISAGHEQDGANSALSVPHLHLS